MKEFIHIGYPKNFSTTLQRDFFPKHSEIFYLGIGYQSNLGYRSSIIEKGLELYIKSAKYLKYVEFENSWIEEVERVRQVAISEGAKAMVLSSEHLSFSFTHDSIDIKQKLERIQKAFKQPKILLIIRNQFELIKSLYRESIRVGLALSFDEYLYSLYKYQDRNFLYDFRYDLILELIDSMFGKGNYGLMFFEDYRDSKGLKMLPDNRYQLIADLCTKMEINYPENFELSHHNEALSSSALAAKLQLNKKIPHDLGNHLLESAEKHRIKQYLEEDLGIHEEESKMYEDVRTKRTLIEQANSEASQKMELIATENIIEKMRAFYTSGNLRLQNLIAQKLPASYLDLKF